MAEASTLRINITRLLERLNALGQVGALEGGGVCRLALSDTERQGRDLVVRWMREQGLTVAIDQIGNVWGTRPGTEEGPPVMMGSHIDTVATGGLYDGNLGVLAGLEVLQVLDDAGVQTRRSIEVGFFTNEEGARFSPDMMGSAVHQGSLALDAALAERDDDGISVGDALSAIGYIGDHAVGAFRAHSFLELHIEQGPRLEREGVTIGAVTGVQGISWTEWTITGTSNHAGTTPMNLRADAGLVAARIVVEAREIARDLGGAQLGTTGFIQLEPNLVNVIAREARLTVDLRNTDWDILQGAIARMDAFARAAAAAEGCEISPRTMVHFPPVAFDPAMIDLVERTAQTLNYSVCRMPSGAGHDAQMFAPNCPTSMIFVPSQGGLSHNVREHTAPDDLEAGANVLLHAALAQAEPTP
jgi:beta-ureidopropionase / N-carbamoyl-L-amino-acid hydrolase